MSRSPFSWFRAQRERAYVTSGIVFVLAALVSGCSKKPTTNDAEEEARQRECPDLKTWAECDGRLRDQLAQQTANLAQQQKEQAASQAAAAASAASKSGTLSREARDNWIRQCVQKLKCKQWHVDAIIAGAPPQERDHAARVSFAASSEDIAQTAHDGSELSAVPAGLLAGLVARDGMGMPLLDEMKPTSMAEAKKDPAGARGKTLKIPGRIIEIRKQGELFEGALVTDSMTFVRFVTAMSTAGLFEDSFATFRGIFLQEFDYANVSGGQTRSLLVVGAFDIPANRTVKPVVHTGLAATMPAAHPPAAVIPVATAAPAHPAASPEPAAQGKTAPSAAAPPSGLDGAMASAARNTGVDEPKTVTAVAPFDRGAAATALGAVNVASCKTADGPTGSGHVKVTFAPDGSVSSAIVEGGAFPGSAVGGCIAGKFRTARVPAFTGSPVGVGRSFTL